jgi:hypothetical protein
MTEYGGAVQGDRGELARLASGQLANIVDSRRERPGLISVGTVSVVAAADQRGVAFRTNHPLPRRPAP